MKRENKEAQTKKSKKEQFIFDVKKIPTDAGCYLFWDQNNDLLYVGKAKNLRKRVSSYFQKKETNSKTKIMVSKISKIETRVTNSEIEALILENNLIKELMPRFNIRLRDDKNFVYLHINKEKCPKMEITRRIIRDGSTYIGPKTATKEFRKLIRFCQKFFHIRMLNPADDYYPDVIAGNYDIPEAEYKENIIQMKKFLNGQTKEVQETLMQQMMDFANKKNFEAAQKIKETLQAIDVSTKKQTVTLSDTKSRDFIHCIRKEDNAFCVRIAFRNGKLIDQNEVELSAKEFLNDEEIFKAFLLQFYPQVDQLPKEIYIPLEIENPSEIELFLKKELKTEEEIKIKVPKKGEKKQILEIAQKNAQRFQERRELEELSQAENFSKALPELAEALELSEPPKRMECYDISHFSGESTVASQVVFVDGKPNKSEYRRFKIKTLVEGKIDDFASMREVLGRRFAKKDDPKFAEKFPDLIVIDGGKGQLSSVMKAVKDFESENEFPESFDPETQIIALAKREEEIFRPGQKDPVLLSLDSSPLKLLQRIRDEAHRFAISYNRVSRQKKAHQSILDEIKGIGTVTKKKLMQEFGSVSRIRKASDKKLLEFLNQKQLQNIRKNL